MEHGAGGRVEHVGAAPGNDHVVLGQHGFLRVADDHLAVHAEHALAKAPVGVRPVWVREDLLQDAGGAVKEVRRLPPAPDQHVALERRDRPSEVGRPHDRQGQQVGPGRAIVDVGRVARGRAHHDIPADHGDRVAEVARAGDGWAQREEERPALVERVHRLHRRRADGDPCSESGDGSPEAVGGRG